MSNILVRGELFKNIAGTDYFHTHEADLSKLKTNKIITHNSDYSISYALSLGNNKEIFEKNQNLLWFAQNVDVVHPRIFSIPIGFENLEWFPQLKKMETLAKFREEITEKNIMCIALFNPSTYEKRLEILKYFYNQPFSVTASTINGYSFEDYAKLLVSSYFCVCPRGNGIDTHRFWEALYCGAIPIVEQCTNIYFYEKLKLPMMVVKDLTQVTLQSLISFLEMWPRNYKSMKECQKYLYMDYWVKYIQGI